MDSNKQEINWRHEELDQWALAARQKEEDNITLEKDKRTDDIKVKEMNLQIERLTLEVKRKEDELAKEITETQASQIELDKTAEEFKRHHEERHRLFLQCQEVSENIDKRNRGILDESEHYAQVKQRISGNRKVLEDRLQTLSNEKANNKSLEFQMAANERRIAEEKSLNNKNEKDISNYEAEVEILKNQLSAFASECNQKRIRLGMLSEDLLVKNQRLALAKKKYNIEEQKLENEDRQAKEFIENKQLAEERFRENEKAKDLLEKEIRLQKKNLFKAMQDLFKERKEEAHLYSEIQGLTAAIRNLQSHSNKLNQEFQRQQELLYNAEYQIQLMERRVARARGERTLEEKRDLENEIVLAEEGWKQITDEHKMLINSLKKLDEDLRAVDRKLNFTKAEKTKYTTFIEELTLENDMTYQDLNKISKSKEEVLVQHDTMKLEIKKIKDVVNNSTNKVFNLENRKYQFEMSIQEREKEINVHKDVLVAEHKAAEEERHKIAVELADRRNRVKNLKIKYESLVQKNKASSGEIETVNEHSQAYYVIKAAQEREELQRKVDELNAKKSKSDKELEALHNTLNHLKNRNSNYRDSFLNKNLNPKDKDLKESLEEQCRASIQIYNKNQREMNSLKKDFEEDLRNMNEIQNKIETMRHSQREINLALEKAIAELKEQDAKIARAKASFERQDKDARKAKVNLEEATNPNLVQLKFDIESNKAKTFNSSIFAILGDFPELSSSFERLFEDNEMKFPSKAPSSIALSQSQQSFSSKGSRR